MIALFDDIVETLYIATDIDACKLCYIYLITYCAARPETMLCALDAFLEQLDSPQPLMRALALKSMTNVPMRAFQEAAARPTKALLKDGDAYVRRTACMAVVKIWSFDPDLGEKFDLITSLNLVLADSNPSVCANACAALLEISNKAHDLQLTLDYNHVRRLARSLGECSEWSQISILSAMLCWVPQQAQQADEVIDLVLPRLQHANTAVVMGAIRVIVF